jgi:hypothetical protein
VKGTKRTSSHVTGAPRAAVYPHSVTGDYLGAYPHTFPGGTIRRVAVDIGGGPYIDLEREAQAMLAGE